MKVVRENGKSIRRYSNQGRFEVWVIQLRQTIWETQNHLDFQSKKKLKRNELFLALGREPRNWEL